MTGSGEEGEGLRDRISRGGEDALGKLAEDLVNNPLVSGALQRAFDARDSAVRAQNAAMGALNIPSAADLERLTRRIRSVSQRLEGIEEGLDRLEDRLKGSAGDGLDKRLDEIAADVRALRESMAPAARG